MPHQKLFLIDSFGFIFRAFHARARSGAPPMRTSTGISTEAVYIFNNMLRKLGKQFDPTYIAAVFESQGLTHRLEEFAEYKANRTGNNLPTCWTRFPMSAGFWKPCASRFSNTLASKPTP